MSLLISNILRDIDLHKGRTHHSNQSENTLCAKQGIYILFGVCNLIRLHTVEEHDGTEYPPSLVTSCTLSMIIIVIVIQKEVAWEIINQVIGKSKKSIKPKFIIDNITLLLHAGSVPLS